MHFIFYVLLVLGYKVHADDLVGVATHLKDRSFVYKEVHQITNDENGHNKQIQTSYQRQDGTIFAKIKSTFLKNEFVPDVEFDDFRFQRKETLTFDSEKNIIVLKKTIKSASGPDKFTENTLKLEKNMVAGQGFNNFIKANFKKLLNEESFLVPFVVLNKLDFFRFDLNRKSEEKGITTFSLKIHSYLLGAFVNEIQIGYNTQTQQIMTFQGLSNIQNDKDEPQEVLIKYESQNK